MSEIKYTMPPNAKVVEIKLFKISYIAGGDGTSKNPFFCHHYYVDERGNQFIKLEE